MKSYCVHTPEGKMTVQGTDVFIDSGILRIIVEDEESNKWVGTPAVFNVNGWRLCHNSDEGCPRLPFEIAKEEGCPRRERAVFPLD